MSVLFINACVRENSRTLVLAESVMNLDVDMIPARELLERATISTVE